MESTPRSPAGSARRMLIVVVATAVACCLAAAPARAGFRDMVKSAKDKTTQKVEKKSGDGSKPCEKVEFTDDLLELTGERLDKFVEGLKAGNAVRGEQGKLILRQNELRSQISELQDEQGQAIAESRQKRHDVSSCQHEAIEESRRQRNEAEREKMMANPASAEKLMRLAARMNEAQMKGDKAAFEKAQQEMEALTGPTSADSLAARKKCGPIPALHPAAVKLESLEKEAAAIDERIRDMDMKAKKLESETSGMTPEQFAMVRERVELYLASLESGPGLACFTAAERAALAARKDALKEALGA